MAEPQKIVLLYKKSSIPDQILKQAQAQAPKGFAFSLCEAKTPDAERKKQVASADYLIAYGVGFEDFEVAKSVKLFQVLSAGFDRLDMNQFKKAKVPVANNGGANAPTVAEHAVLLMLSVFKKLPLHHNTMQSGQWLGHREALRMRELRDKQVGIVGFGHIGREAARNVRGFLANVAYYDPMGAPAEVEKQLSAKRMELDELIRTSDVISVHTPLTKATRGLFGAKQFAAMKPTAIFINTSRGPVVDEDALVDAVRNGVIAGAGLDVFGIEPLPPDHPLRTLPNSIVTPHVGGFVEENYRLWYGGAVEDILAWLDGAPIRVMKEPSA